MLTVSTLIWFVCLIIWSAHGQLTGDEIEPCRAQTFYSLRDLQSVTIALYYDVDPGLVDDCTYVKAMCKARKSISHATFEFYPGVGTKLNDNHELTCNNADLGNTDCTESIAVACASRMVNDFVTFVCCRADGGKTSDCVKAQIPNKMNEFEECTQMKNVNIKPDQILLNNAAAADGKYVALDWLPMIRFDGNLDPCASFIFEEKPVEVICAMLAEHTDDACKEPN